ncbi:hypothetical protein [Flavobacterium psychrotrophum]|uniref:hypothetical protein n=1 Tax=Flavobacterium psychrotrophum TaxID=2294119 RepID=UPI000E317C9D|nr:hypothetical protein [Flavobacterium psychrotrophum]
MKKFSFYSAFFLPLFIICGCSSDSVTGENRNTALRTSSSSDNSVILPEYFDFIGEAHNSGLDYVYDNAIKNNGNLKYADIKGASLYYFDNIYNLTKGNAKQNYTPEHDTIVKISVESNKLMPAGHDYSSFSKEEISFINNLELIIDENSDIVDKIKKIDLLNKKIYMSDLEDNQLTRLYMTNSVAKSSLTYWNSSKRDKWLDTFPIGNPASPTGPTYPITTMGKIDWSNVAKADIAAFLMAFPFGVKAGAIKGAIVLGLASGGTGAVAGAIIGALGGGAAAGATAAVGASAAWLGAEAIVSWWQ